MTFDPTTDEEVVTPEEATEDVAAAPVADEAEEEATEEVAADEAEEETAE